MRNHRRRLPEPGNEAKCYYARYNIIILLSSYLSQTEFIADCRHPISLYQNNITGCHFKLFATQMDDRKQTSFFPLFQLIIDSFDNVFANGCIFKWCFDKFNWRWFSIIWIVQCRCKTNRPKRTYNKINIVQMNIFSFSLGYVSMQIFLRIYLNQIKLTSQHICCSKLPPKGNQTICEHLLYYWRIFSLLFHLLYWNGFGFNYDVTETAQKYFICSVRIFDVPYASVRFRMLKNIPMFAGSQSIRKSTLLEIEE